MFLATQYNPEEEAPEEKRVLRKRKRKVVVEEEEVEDADVHFESRKGENLVQV